MSRRVFLLGSSALASGVVLSGTTGGVARAAAEVADPAAGPPIISCDGWGARPSSAVVPILPDPPVKILVHHTADPNTTDYSRAAAVQRARDIQDFHLDRRGWVDSGQHFTISRGGFVLEGRHRSLEVLRAGRRQVEGSHCTGQNAVSIGIENEGSYGEVEPPAALWTRLRELCAYICAQYRIRPTSIYGHRDHKDTACPGDRLYALLPTLRVDVAAILGVRLKLSAATSPAWPLIRPGDRGPRVLAAQHLLRSAGQPTVVLDGRFGPAMAESVRGFQAANALEEITGLIGGETWPILTQHLPADETTAEAVAALLAAQPPTHRTAAPATTDAWQRLLTTPG